MILYSLFLGHVMHDKGDVVTNNLQGFDLHSQRCCTCLGLSFLLCAIRYPGWDGVLHLSITSISHAMPCIIYAPAVLQIQQLLQMRQQVPSMETLPVTAYSTRQPTSIGLLQECWFSMTATLPQRSHSVEISHLPHTIQQVRRAPFAHDISSLVHAVLTALRHSSSSIMPMHAAHTCLPQSICGEY